MYDVYIALQGNLQMDYGRRMFLKCYCFDLQSPYQRLQGLICFSNMAGNKLIKYMSLHQTTLYILSWEEALL